MASAAENQVLVFFDLETTGLDTDACDIIQVAAVCGQQEFNGYSLPRRPLSQSATRVTGFTVHSSGLYRRGARIRTVPVRELLTSFIHFLRSFRRPVLLAAHNARRFDTPVLTRVLLQQQLLQQFQQVVSGFLDTFLLSKNLFPRLYSYSQKNLVRLFLQRSYDAHNAVEDAKVLQELYQAWSPSRYAVSSCTFTPYEFYG